MTKDDIAPSLRRGESVIYEGATYRLLGFYLWYDKVSKTLKYSAELEDKNGRTIIRAPIEKVELINKN